MKVALAAAISINGKITKGKNVDVSAWTSREDKRLFSALKKEFSVIVMGSKTYDAIRNNLRPRAGRGSAKRTLRIVLTRNPKRYAKDAIDGVLEFTNETPRQLLRRLEKKGYKKILLAGGGIINGLFLRQGLVDELYLTVEPFIFGSGQELAAAGSWNVTLELQSIKRLNKKGSLYLKYKVNPVRR